MSDSKQTSESSNENSPNQQDSSKDNTDNINTAAAPFLSDLTDGREKGNWQSRYIDSEAKKAITYEKNYLLSLIGLNILTCIVLGLLIEHTCIGAFCPTFRKYIFAFLGGMLGGCVFSAKWLVHSVAKFTWNRDRRLWRIFTPIISGVLGFSIILLLSTNVISIGKLDSADMHKCFGIAFLIGYFSDNAIGKLTEIAQVFFGSSINRK